MAALIADRSILRRLPPGIGARQLVSLDAVRHSSDIISLADERLRGTLTEIARDIHTTPALITSAFSDVWSIIDAMDRIRSMVKLLVRQVDSNFNNEARLFTHDTQPIRALRNLTDHLYQRVDHVISSNMPAVGRLSWVTVLTTLSARVCVLDPGSVRTKKKSISFPNIGGRPTRIPTGAVLLSAGEHEAWLDNMYSALSRLLISIEQSVEDYAEANNLAGIEVGRDFLLCGNLVFNEEVVPADIDDGQLRLF